MEEWILSEKDICELEALAEDYEEAVFHYDNLFWEAAEIDDLRTKRLHEVSRAYYLGLAKGIRLVLRKVGRLNRPVFDGDSIAWKGWSHVNHTCIPEAVPARAA